VVGGRNGYGAKLANIFSTRFSVEAADSKAGSKFFMEWTQNMSKHGPAKITKHSGPDHTCVRFYPDFKLFHIDGLATMLPLLKKRVYDMAGIFGGRLKVYYNNELIKLKSFEEYVRMYVKEAPLHRDRALEKSRWEVLASFSEGEFQQVSFVNGICTTRGGTHVNFLAEQIVSRVQEAVEKKAKDLRVKPHQVKQHLWLFVNCLVENPSFDSQTK
jgi:DNA topoisomerase-2